VSIFYEKIKEPEFTKLIQKLDLGTNKIDVEFHLLVNGTSDITHGIIYNIYISHIFISFN